MRVAPTTDIQIVNINERQAQPIQPQQKWKSYALRIAIFLTFVGNFVVTYWVMFMKNQPFEKEYFIYITPSPIFFKILPVIYTTIFISVIHNLYKNIWRTKSSVIYIVSNILIMISSSIWAVRNVTSIAVSGFVLASVDNANIYFWRVLIDEHLEALNQVRNEQENQEMNNTQISIQNPSNPIIQNKKQFIPRYTELQIFLVRNVFSLYIGWITVTGTVIIGLSAVYWWGLSLCQQFIIFWITTPVAIIALYLFLVLRQQGEYKYCFGYVLAVVWGFVGAGIASVQSIASQGSC